MTPDSHDGLAYSEVVCGTVIGPISCRFRVVQPNGTVCPFWAESTQEAKEIHQRMIDNAYAQGPVHIVEMIYGKGEWVLQEETFDD